ncbi:hypothetical protein HX021_09650 [Sphingobacterium sp. N143]|nr:hypothetical protein [Sphingobacterium sp. N143]
MLSLLFIVVHCSLKAQHQIGDGVYLAQDGPNKNLILITDHYFSLIKFDNKQFEYTWGGPLQQQGDSTYTLIEYNTIDSTKVGKKIELDYKGNTDSLLLKLSGSYRLFLRQKAIPQDLDALWRITGRQQEGKMHEIPKNDRKTIKLLVDGYFQWIAINPALKGFYGTGGGYYNYRDNRYTEKILFFSRDNNRIGQELNFDGKLEKTTWHHKGKSSKGDDIYEIWSKETAK